MNAKSAPIEAKEQSATSDAAVQTAVYIGDLVQEMEKLAKNSGLGVLSGLLRVAGDEARRVTEHG